MWIILLQDSSQFSVTQIEYPLGGSSTKGSHVYFLLIIVMVLLLWCQIVLLWHQVTMVAIEQHLYQTIVQFDKIIVFTQKTCNRKYTWLPFLLLSPSEYSIWGTENYTGQVYSLSKTTNMISTDDHHLFLLWYTNLIWFRF